MARTIDWVEEQSSQDEPSTPEAVVPCAQPVTPPPRNLNCENDTSVTKLRSAAPTITKCHSKLVYSISTLLSMRHLQGAVPVMLRVKPEAIAENIFQYMGASTARRLPSRSRGLSEMSNISRASMASNSFDHGASIGSKFMNIPKLNRQAPPPIGIPPLLPRQDGFVRFLQQHASPPHHRVTAGGRIVPTGPTSPPPMFDFSSLNGMVRRRLADADAAQKEQPNLQTQGGTSINSGNLGGYPSNQGAIFAGQPGFPASNTIPTAPYNGTQYGYQPLMTPTMQTPSAMVPIAVFPDGSTLVSCNGTHYRTYWNGLSTVMEPVQYLPQQTDEQTLAGYQAPSSLLQPGFMPQAAQPANTSRPLRNITNGSRASSNRKTSNSRSVLDISAKETAFKQELTNLDKHMALYHFEITPPERTEMVAQRRYLVESLDKIRVSKENENRSIPIIAPDTGLPITPPIKPTAEQKATINGTEAQKKPISKTLSPAAPPFVPKSSWSGPYGLPEKRTFSDQSTQYGDVVPSTKHNYDQPLLNIKDIANAAMARKAQNAYNPSGSTQVTSHRQASSSSVLDPSDPAMRVIDYEDIEYASRYLYNWGLDKKTYCTTVAEFQEAIRRVREQARRCGCHGGSSKDPAYDAEQDIWWAICDRDPIPLPAIIADDVSNTRQWNWEDSAFNFRRKGAPLPPLNIDNARNSPRLAGWDPITTESMRDKTDITRSYYAFKGQLPTTPFRTWAYDDAGNKVEIGDPHFLDHSHFRPELPKRKTSTNLANPHQDQQYENKSAVSNTYPISAPANTLRPLNTNEINSRSTKPRFKDGRKMNKTEGDAPPPSRSDKPESVTVPSRSSPKLERAITPCPASPNRDTTTVSERPSHGLHLHTPHVQIYSEKPVALPTSPALQLGLSGTTIALCSSVTLGNIWNATDRPALESRISMGASHARYPDIEMGGNKSNPSSNNDAGNPGPPRLGSGSPPATIAFELSAETRSPWGPDEGCASVSYGPVLTTLEVQEPDKIARVNLPIGAHDHIPLASNHKVPEVKHTDTASFETPSHQFLRKMLKSPTYSSVQASKPAPSSTFGIAERLSKLLRGGGDNSARGINKENASSNDKLREASSKLRPKDGYSSGPPLLLKSEPEFSVSKAPSSLASSSYQAQGHLPQSEAAKKAPARSSHQVNDQSPKHVRVNLPSSTSYGESPTASLQCGPHDVTDPGKFIPTAAYLTPVGFGYDGGSDPQPPTGIELSKANSMSNPDFDYKGVTAADYETHRESTDNEWHRGAVRDFFEDVAAKERQEIESAKQPNASGARTS